MNNKSEATSSGGIGVLGLLGVLFVGLKLTGVIDWSWWWVGDLRDALLDRVRNLPKPWAMMSPDEQRDQVEGCTMIAEHLVQEAVRIIASKGFPTIHGKLVKVQVKDGMQLQVDVSRHDPQRLIVIDSVERPVLLVVPEPDMFMGEKDKPKTSLDEKLGL